MINDKQRDLSLYRYQTAVQTMNTAKLCYENKCMRDAINRSYYAAFYAVKSVLALEEVDFKRHKDVMSYFNKNYVATEIFPKTLGRKLGRLQQKRETSDYDDFYVAAAEEAEEQLQTAQVVIDSVVGYLKEKEVIFKEI